PQSVLPSQVRTASRRRPLFAVVVFVRERARAAQSAARPFLFYAPGRAQCKRKNRSPGENGSVLPERLAPRPAPWCRRGPTADRRRFAAAIPPHLARFRLAFGDAFGAGHRDGRDPLCGEAAEARTSRSGARR